MDKECCMYDPEGTYATLSFNRLYYQSIWTYWCDTILCM
jgi:hypothetical protein